MLNSKNNLEKRIFILAFLFAIVFSFGNLVSAVGESTVCCERTLQGAWCQNVQEISQCNTASGLKAVPTSCEATSYCKPGTCVNVQEGLCMENTPQKVCEGRETGEASGLWFDSKSSEIPQCQLGCCLIGEQAAFTTQTRCKQLSSLYGLEINYRTDITNEAQCIASAFPKVKGACVFEEELQKKCKFVTSDECKNSKTSGESPTFYPGFLCSSEELGTICGPSEKTMLVDGRDEIFFVDTCGNLANIYDAGRQDDSEYWNKIVPKSLSCGFDSANGNARSPACGNCDYLAGSTGKLYDRFADGAAANPEFGNYICRSLDCTLNGETFKHGETWCSMSEGISQIKVKDGVPVNSGTKPTTENLPGSRYFREVCYNGEVTIEPCADFRQEVCFESSITTEGNEPFRTASCKVNKWQDCMSIVAASNSKEDILSAQKTCDDSEKRDCKWELTGFEVKTTTEGQILGLGGTENTKKENKFACVPKYSPGFNFWDAETDAQSLCFQASKTCVVEFQKNLQQQVTGEGWECKKNCDCLKDNGETFKNQNAICLNLGDCGVKTNYIGKSGGLSLGDLISRTN